MKVRQYLLIILVIFAIGYTTADRWSDAAELITPDIGQLSMHIGSVYGHNVSSAHIELFCEFPMIAKATLAFVAVFFSAPFLTFFFAARLNDYPRERFRPPAVTV